MMVSLVVRAAPEAMSSDRRNMNASASGGRYVNVLAESCER
jgi:hypothetical protein